MAANFLCEDIALAALGSPVRKQCGELLWHCPFHRDTHPSFQVNPRKNLFSCFPCGISGTAWQLAARFAGVDPSEKSKVAEWLKAKGLILPKSPSTPKEAKYER